MVVNPLSGIAVTNIPAYSTMSVAQMVMAHLLNITNQVALHAEAVRKGEWQNCKDFSFTKAPLIELDGLTFGIVGLGNIGKQVAKMVQTFGMKVLAVSSKSEAELRQLNIRKATGYEQLFSEADVVSLHCPLTNETHHLVNRERLALMKPTAILINTGRGPLLDEQAVSEALSAGKLYAVGIDVLTEEPPRKGSPLLPLKGAGGSAPNCFITPHIAWASKAARRRLIDIATQNVAAFLQGKELNRI